MFEDVVMIDPDGMEINQNQVRTNDTRLWNPYTVNIEKARGRGNPHLDKSAALIQNLNRASSFSPDGRGASDLVNGDDYQE